MDKALIEELKELKERYTVLADEVENEWGLENIDSDTTETYGMWRGKADLCEYLLTKYNN